MPSVLPESFIKTLVMFLNKVHSEKFSAKYDSFIFSFPLRIHLFSTVNRATRVIIGVWIVAFLAASPVAYLVVINKIPVPDFAKGVNEITLDDETIIDTEYCGINNARMEDQKRLFYSTFVIFFLLPG